MRFELMTPSLPWKCSTPELRRQNFENASRSINKNAEETILDRVYNFNIAFILNLTIFGIVLMPLKTLFNA